MPGLNRSVFYSTEFEPIKLRKAWFIMEWYCCDRCQHCHNCETKWFRGEKNIPQFCCPNCNNYSDCYEKYKAEEAEKAKEAAKEVIVNKKKKK